MAKKRKIELEQEQEKQEKPKPPKKRLLDFFIEGNNKGYQEILNVMLEGDNDLDLKTHVIKPKKLSALFTFQEYISVKQPSTSLLIDIFTTKFNRYMVSYKRMSRIEIIKALSMVTMDQDFEQVTASKRMTTNLKK
jgi:hypothetical protein